MEVERVRPKGPEQVDDITTLPPPPAPFPTDLLNSTDASSPDATQTVLHTQVASVQRAIVDVLTDLLSSSPSLDDPSYLNEHDQRLATALTELLEVTDDLPVRDERDHALSGERELEGSFEALKRCLEDLQNSARDQVTNSDLHPAVHVVRTELAWARLDSLSSVIMSLVEERRFQAEGASQAEGQAQAQADGSLPPRYSFDSAEQASEGLPKYSDHLEGDADTAQPREEKAKASTSLRRSVSAPREKTMLELDGLTDAIDRLHSAIPRLNDQRVEMRASSSKQPMTSSAVRARTERNKLKELEVIWDQIERTHGKNKIGDGQRVDVADWAERRSRQKERYLNSLFDNGDANRLHDQDSSMGKVEAELARARDLRDRDLFLRGLVEHSADSRLFGQDAEGRSVTPRSAEERRQRFFSSLLAQSRSGHLDEQDYPLTLDERLDQRRRDFIESIVQRTANGRLRNQDSAPSTPRVRTESSQPHGAPNELVTMEDFFKDQGKRSNSTPNEVEKKANGFERIKGIIRRGSAGLGLKINNERDLADLSYVAEHQENLNVIQVMVHGAGISAQSDLSIESDDLTSDVATLVSKSSIARITLPTPAIAGQTVPLILHNLHLEAKLASVPTSPSAPVSSLNTVINPALSASELRRLQPKCLCCSACDREVAELPPTNAYKDLPSEHWAEMLEVWMCHSDPGFTAGISAKAKDGFWPANGTVLVGGSYLLLEPEFVKPHNLVVDDQPVAGWQSVHCACGEALGKQREVDDKPGSGTMRFSKWSIALLQDDTIDGERVEPVRYALSVFVVSDLLELAQAHASYRFTIADEESGQPRLLVWLFNPSTRISYRQSSTVPQPSPMRTPKASSTPTPAKRRSFASTRSRRSSQTSMSSAVLPAIPDVKSMRAAKIMYKVLDTDEPYDNVPGFGPGGQVEHLRYPREVAERLIAALRQSTALYPFGRRTMGVFEVGFLERV